jgi:hypothetical protein
MELKLLVETPFLPIISHRFQHCISISHPSYTGYVTYDSYKKAEKSQMRNIKDSVHRNFLDL